MAVESEELRAPSLSFGSAGGAVLFIDATHALAECANGLCVLSLESGVAIQHVSSECERGISAFAACQRGKCFAYAPRTAQPAISVVGWPECEVVARLGGGSELEYVAVSLSSDAETLLALSAPAENELFLWHVADATLAARVSLGVSAVSFASVSRGNARLACSGGALGVSFWRLAATKRTPVLERVAGQVVLAAERAGAETLPSDEAADEEEDDDDDEGDGGRASLREATSQSLANDLVAHCWTESGETLLAASRAGCVLEFEAASGQCLRLVCVPELAPPRDESLVPAICASALAVLCGHVVVACDDGLQRWLHLGRFDGVEFKSGLDSLRNQASKGESEEGAVVSSSDEQRNRRVVSCVASSANDQLLLATSGGGLYSLLFQDVDDSPPDLHPLAECLAELHAGPVVGACAVTGVGISSGEEEEQLVATGAVDGRLKLWAAATGASRGEHVFYAKVLAAAAAEDRGSADDADAVYECVPITALSAAPKDPLVACGLSSGVLYLMQVAHEKRPAARRGDAAYDAYDTGLARLDLAPVANVQLYHDAITALSFHSSEPLLAAGCGAARGAHVIQLVKTKSCAAFEVVCYCECASPLARVTCVGFAAAQRLLLVACDDATVCCCEVPRKRDPSACCEPAPLLWSLALPGGGGGCGPLISLRTVTAVGVSAAEGSVVVAAAVFPAVSFWGSCAESSAVRLLELAEEPLALVCKTATDEALHERCVVSLAVSRDGSLLASGDADGSVCVWRVTTREERRQSATVAQLAFSRQHAHVGCVLCLAFADDGRLWSCGTDKAVLARELGGGEESPSSSPAERQPTPVLELSSTVDEDVPERRIVAPSRPSVREKHLQRLFEQRQADAQAHRAVRHNVVADLKHRLSELLRSNDLAPQLERLERDEFVVDVAGSELAAMGHETRAREAGDKIRLEDELRDQVSLSIKSDCWDGMEVKATQVLAMVPSAKGNSVCNFPRPRESDDAKVQQKLKTLRKFELRDIQHATTLAACSSFSKGSSQLQQSSQSTASSGSLQQQQQRRQRGGGGAARNSTTWQTSGEHSVVPHQISWIVNEGALRPAAQGCAVSHAQMDESNEDEDGDNNTAATASGAKEYVVDCDSLTAQLYPPSAVLTCSQKRTQIALVHCLIAELETAFNAQFSAVYAQKRDEMDKIEEKNVRAREVLDELRSSELVFAPQLDVNVEQPESILTVRDCEMSSRPYEDAAAIAKRDEEARRRALEDAEKNNVAARALDDMMHNTLETKKDEDLMVALEPPAWLVGEDGYEVDKESLTEERVRELVAYELALKQLEEEREKRRKALELELKKLRAEIHDVARVFDDKLNALSQQRVLATRAVATQEFYALRLVVSLAEHEDAQHTGMALKRDCASKRAELELAEQRARDCDKALHAAEQRVEHVANEDRLMDRNFRRDLQTDVPLDQETLRGVVGMFRQRAPPYVSPRDDEDLREGLLDDDEEAAEDTTTSEQGGPAGMLARAEGLQDGFKVDDATLAATFELRNRKMDKEKELQDAHHAVKAQRASQLELAQVVVQLRGAIQAVSSRCEQYASKLGHAERGVEILVRLQQGQDEVEQETVVTDYSDAVLIPVALVSKVNDEIRKNGAEQVRVLLKIKHFRKSINYMSWENTYMEQQARDLEEYYTDLQLIHVTKNLQSIMRGDPAKRETEHATKLDARIKMMDSIQEDNCAALKRANAKVAHRVREREDENERLRLQIKELESNVDVRESIFKTHDDREGGGGGQRDASATKASNNMKRIILRRRLIDLARLQTEEIDFLRQELDRLRQRTFPSFAHATRSRFATLPDAAF